VELGFRSIEICAGAGGQALGLEHAGFNHIALVELDPHACRTLRRNRPSWPVIEGDVNSFSAECFDGVDLLAGGVPCPPFSVAGHQLGQDDERDLFPQALRLVAECSPRAVMLENVRGLLDSRFDEYRARILGQLDELGYWAEWRLLNAADFGVAQLRPRAILVAIRRDLGVQFSWPEPSCDSARTVGEALVELMASGGWDGAKAWSAAADRVAPTLVGGSKKHGGPDLGPTRAKRAWAELGVDAHGVADAPPCPGFSGLPRLTVAMTGVLQGFPEEWVFEGRKTAAYRQVGNAFPPPVAEAVGRQIAAALDSADAMSETRECA
jgi:DNA (cytosine-5)-methyltransferase 1